MTKPPPYRIETERLVVRCWEPRDAPLLKEAVDSSLDHLRRWMPWAHAEPQPLSEKVELLRMFRGHFDLGQDFIYAIFSSDESEVVGGTGLHRRSFEGVLEIGYWISAARTRQGLGTEATAAVARVGFEVAEASRIEIRVDPDNAASLAIPRKLGFVEEGTLRRVLHGFDGTPLQRDALVFALLREEFPGSPAASIALRAFDAGGNLVLGS
jgi:RimJ/RimL family protein N-acetyltransferase